MGAITLSASAAEGLGIAEETGDRDQHFPPQGNDLVAVVLQQIVVLIQLRGVAHLHPPVDAPHDRGRLVVGEVDAADLMQQMQKRRAPPRWSCWRAAPAAAARSRVPVGQGCGCAPAAAPAISSAGRMASTKPVAMTLRGMPSNLADSGSWAMRKPPAALMATEPRVPSVPVPERMMPTACGRRLGQRGEEDVDGQGQAARILRRQMQMPRPRA
jgi:hypothetical protein